MRRTLYLILLLVVVAGSWLLVGDTLPRTFGPAPEPGTALDSLNGVVVYHNGGMSALHGRNTVDGYNVGLRYQCVEFVKRYYLEHYDHRMPDSYGNAKDFFDPALKDGEMNASRGLLQFTNPSPSSPQAGDLVVFDAWAGNSFGHVAIVSEVKDGEVEVIQQNTGSTRSRYDLDLIDGRWRMGSRRILGWLRMP
jgi:surface antigen